MKKVLFLIVTLVCAVTGAWAAQIGSGSGTYVVAGGVVTFSGTTAGEINQNWSSLNFNGATRIKFDNTCVVNKDDLMKFLGTQNATYYLDFFDITKGDNAKMHIEAYPHVDDDNDALNIDLIIEAAVADMVANGWQAKGIILPLNTGSGTTKVERATTTGETKSTFTEYAAYYRQNTNPSTVAIYSHDEDMKNNWRNKNDHTTAQTHFETAYAHLTAHTDVASATTYIVSTNSRKMNSDEPLNLSSITKSNATKISIVNDEFVYTANAGDRSLLAFISVEGATGGDFAAAVANTNINGTPCEELTVRGPVTSADIAAVNLFNNTGEAARVEGPHVYNLANTEYLAKADLASITNSSIEYIILPPSLAEEQLGKEVFSTSLTDGQTSTFKAAAAASDDKTKLSAYVNVAGNLAKVRCYATGNSANSAGEYKPTTRNLTSVILGGNLNASDIGTQDSHGLRYEYNSITSIDMEKAYFANASDMKLCQNNGAGLTNVTSVKLPADTRMDEIPENCLYGLSSLHDLHIPYNYKKIRGTAFWDSGINHITTEDANHALIDNGPNTYTLSANIEELGVSTQSNGVFPRDSKITDVYCLATKVPTCYAKTFAMEVTFANGGANAGPYCREKYISDNGGKVIAVLHFPNEESFNNVKNADDKETNYATMKSLYTDPYRVFTKKDQTVAVDTEGNPLLWPDQKELESSYYSAQDGHIWTDYELQYASDGHMEGLGKLKDNSTKPFYPNYVGWHEFVLSQANYVDPDETVINKVVERKYEDAGWYTICIPYNLTRSQVLNMMGVPASNSKIKNYLLSKDETNNTTTYGEVTTDLMPDIRQLKSVTRKKKGEGDSQNQVKFYLTKNLYGYKESQPTHTYYLNFTEKDGHVTEVGEADADGNNNSVDPICLVGGRPYIIKIYKREGVTISQQNIGKYILTHYGDELGLPASCLNNGSDYYEQLMDEKAEKKDLVTLQFVKPYEKHLVQALVDDKNSTPITYTENGKKYRYYYAMQGQFWDQDLPEYCFYISKGKWFHYMNKSKNYKWNAYKCVIMATPLEVEVTSPVIPTTAAQVVEKQKIDHDAIVIGDIAVTDKPTVKAEIEKAKDGALSWESHWGLGFRWYPFCWFPQPEKDTEDLLKSNFRLGFMGRDDDDFDKWGMARYIFDFDGDSVVEYDEDGNETTAIDMLDGESQRTDRSGKVYSISGQYMGTTTENLPKGIYVVGGRKIVVD